MVKLLWIAVGGAAGSVLRYALAGVVQNWSGGTFPLGTMVVNLIGCLVMGFLGYVLTEYWLIREEYRLALLFGLLGGFTTFSTFGWDALRMASDGETARAILYITVSNVGGLFGVWAGYRLAVRWYGV